MTVSALVRLSPVPPALRLIKKTSALRPSKSSTSFWRSWLAPVSAMKPTLRSFKPCASKSNMRVNCENTSTRRPCSSCVVQLEEQLILRRGLHRFRGVDLGHQARIAAHLAQLHQRVQDRDRRARD